MITDLATAEFGAVVAEWISQPLSREDIARYAQASGDLNPLHLDAAFAQQAGFDDVIVHGMLGMALLGRLLSRHYPTSNVRQFSARFVAIIKVGQRLHCSAQLLERDSNSATLSLEARDEHGTVVISGRATLAL